MSRPTRRDELFSRVPNVSQSHRATGAQFEQLFAALIALTLTVRTPVASWLTVGGTIAVALLPVVMSRAVWHRTRWILVLVASAALSGAVLAFGAVAEDRSRHVSGDFFIYDLGTLIGLGIIIVAALWSTSKLGVRKFLLLWAIGYLPVAVLSTPLWAVNPWKFALAFPVTIILLAAASRSRRTPFVVLILLCAVSVIAGYRSWALGLLLAALVCLVLSRYSE